MIVRPKPTLRDLLFAMHGSILPGIIGRLIAIALVTLIAILFSRTHPGAFARIGTAPFTLIGLALSIFMSFRNNACYDRWWEGRRLWGSLIIATRSLSRRIATLDPADRDPLLRGICAYVTSLAARLRNADEVAAIARWCGDGPWTTSPNPTNAVLYALGQSCLKLAHAGRIEPIHHSLIEESLGEIAHVQGGCERIATTPLPFSYSLLLHRTAYIFCLTLPFALAGSLGWWTFLPVVLICYTFFGLDALGDQLEDPFGLEPNDLPLDAMSRTVEREILALLGEAELPPPIAPHNYILS